MIGGKNKLPLTIRHFIRTIKNLKNKRCSLKQAVIYLTNLVEWMANEDTEFWENMKKMAKLKTGKHV